MSQRGEGWAVGDLALCVTVRHRAFTNPSSLLRVGAVYTVEVVGRPVKWMDGEIALGFVEVKPLKPNRGFPAVMFRKINPHTPDSFDHEVIEQMAGLPVGVE